MSDRVVGLLDGHFVYEDSRGGYEMDVKGHRVAIKPSFHHHIKLCFEHHEPSVGSKRQRQDQQQEGRQHPSQAAAAAAAVGDGDNRDDGFTVTPCGIRYRIVREGTGKVPTVNDMVKLHWATWTDGFHGKRNAMELPGLVIRVAGENDCEKAMLGSMREGEIRQFIDPQLKRYVEMRLISIEGIADAIQRI
ncbi:unnamed protein product [Vitrella brassicaformis CCMP3155]|uniref:Uncharacterized protein n=2 Tax=Vitrella brassicaformis TaxID=1169539 RepID=A0A0G4GIF8_VITBC|nr:unnamed protein product [Vitrella brassicaformis CCMP3155]|eukprot:CEM29653.1 unnamed protein product [Vitrella brassicaformis CCMP3155]